MTPVLAIATVPAVLAVVNLLKDLGLPSRFGSLAAVIVGVAAAVLAAAVTGPASGRALTEAAASGLILGLSASGLYDATKTRGEPNA